MDGISSRRRRRRNYRILEDETDSTCGSLIQEREAGGVSEVFCDKCRLRNRRRLATKRCLDCMQNVCEACADHDNVYKSSPWFPYCLVQLWRIVFPCTRPVPHSVLDLTEIDNSLADQGLLPKWARFTSSEDVFVIPRVTRDSLRGRYKRRNPRGEQGHQTTSSLGTEQQESQDSMDRKSEFCRSPHQRSIHGNVRLQYKYQNRHGVPTETVYTEHTFSSHPASRGQEANNTSYYRCRDEAPTPYIVEEPPDSCPVCLEDIPVKEARTLNCDHPIHTRCLLELIHRMDFDFGIKCPVCTQMTNVKNYYVSRDRWIYEFPVV